MMRVRLSSSRSSKRDIWFAAANWFCCLPVAGETLLVVAFVDWYRSPESSALGYAKDKQTGLPKIQPMTRTENNKWSRWVFMDSVEPVNVMLGKLPEVKGYFAINTSSLEELEL